MPSPGEGETIMSFGMFVTWVLVGALAGVLANVVMPRDGHGLKVDVGLGLAGSLVGGWILHGLVYAGTGMFGAVAAAFIGAAVVLVAQRKFRPMEPPAKPGTRGSALRSSSR
jgi:uncharacterized membrane protein YeaQ/YmgE (transglycosylase-associated protein family)